VCYRQHPDDILVRVGTSTLGEGGSLHEVTKIILHANYNEDIDGNCDIALLKVRIIIIVLLDWFCQKYIWRINKTISQQKASFLWQYFIDYAPSVAWKMDCLIFIYGRFMAIKLTNCDNHKKCLQHNCVFVMYNATFCSLRRL